MTVMPEEILLIDTLTNRGVREIAKSYWCLRKALG